VADTGLEELRAEVDTLITIPNQRLFEVVDPDTPFTEAFRIADDVLLQATRGISDLITVTGLINLDFADVKSIMAGMGPALMGVGRARGEGRAAEAARQAITCPLLQEQDVTGAQGVLINLTGSRNMTLREVTIATDLITEAVGDGANIIFGTVLDETDPDLLTVTVIATGFGMSRQAFTANQQESYQKPRALAAKAAAGSPPVEPRIIEIVPAREDDAQIMPMPRDLPEEAVSILSREAEEMKAEVLPDLKSVVSPDDWDVPTFLRKQSD